MGKDTIYSRFSQWATRQPDATAVVEDGRSITFDGLDRLADAIMEKFHGERHQFIGIIMSHSIEMIAAMLAVLKSGTAYVPAEPSLPRERIDYMMKTAGVRLVITDEFCRDIAPKHAATFHDLSTPRGVAYVLYTSGTTGRPKGVVVENHSVVNYAEAFEEEFHTAPGDVMLQYSICSFDIFVEEVFATLLNGATLAIPPKSVREGGIDALIDFCERHNVTEISGFPYLVADMNRHLRYPSRLRLLISGGDVVRDSYISRLRNRGFTIYNTYGPSETTVCATYYRIDNTPALDDGTFPVGKPVKGVDVRILDKNRRELPDGAVGEIAISGTGVSRGYLGNPPEQANFATLADGTRIYLSGDLGYRLPDGNIAFPAPQGPSGDDSRASRRARGGGECTQRVAVCRPRCCPGIHRRAGPRLSHGIFRSVTPELPSEPHTPLSARATGRLHDSRIFREDGGDSAHGARKGQ